jgi:hypothetical protein
MVHDICIDLPFGRLRLLQGGGSGGHNGVRSITGLLGPDYVRLRIGVDRPPSTDPEVVADYVLSPFAENKVQVRELVERAADSVELWLSEGYGGCYPQPDQRGVACAGGLRRHAERRVKGADLHSADGRMASCALCAAHALTGRRS